MYRVMIVEDEMLVRMGLKNSIDWSRFGMYVAADAEDGTTAFELYEKEKPDVIITDLKMPGMSGMELIARIREKDKSTKIVILTCLEEFDLVRKAISMGVSDYLLKLTMTVEQTNEVLARIQAELSEDKSRQSSAGPDDSNSSMLKEKIMKDFLFYGIYGEKEFASLVRKYDFHFTAQHLILCILEMDQHVKTKSLFRDENGQLVKHAMLNILKEVLVGRGNGEVLFDDGARYIVLFNCGLKDEEQERTEDILSTLREMEAPVNAYFNTTVSFGVSSIRSDYAFLREMYREALLSLEDKFFGGTGIYGVHGGFDREERKKRKTEELLTLCDKVIGTGAAAFFNEFSVRIRTILQPESRSRGEYRDLFSQLIQWAVNTVKFHDDGSEQIIFSAIQSVQQSETLDEIYRTLYEFLSRISAARRRKKIASREVSLALDYMEANFDRELSLQQVAAHVGLSASYLSSQFKKETEVNFVEYLNEIRIEKAKELLLDTYLKTYEIAESVGFNEITYFCRIFKKIAGTTPSGYRRQWLKTWAGEPEEELNVR